ncbi:MAG: hypothetical protein NTX25_05040, partial [Proteobacteria bacterium]|nr:hypothetical protein [Pseudomonadota bacterium]
MALHHDAEYNEITGSIRLSVSNLLSNVEKIMQPALFRNKFVALVATCAAYLLLYAIFVLVLKYFPLTSENFDIYVHPLYALIICITFVLTVMVYSLMTSSRKSGINLSMGTNIALFCLACFYLYNVFGVIVIIVLIFPVLLLSLGYYLLTRALLDVWIKENTTDYVKKFIVVFIALGAVVLGSCFYVAPILAKTLHLPNYVRFSKLLYREAIEHTIGPGGLNRSFAMFKLPAHANKNIRLRGTSYLNDWDGSQGNNNKPYEPFKSWHETPLSEDGKKSFFYKRKDVKDLQPTLEFFYEDQTFVAKIELD